MTYPRIRDFPDPEPSILPDELLVAIAMPVTTAVHQVICVINEDGRFEYGERMTPGLSGNSRFHVERGQLPVERLSDLQTQLDRLGVAHSSVHDPIPFDQIDPAEYETRDRRLINFWVNGNDSRCCIRNRSVYDAYSISHWDVDTCLTIFDTIWRLCLSLPSTPMVESESPIVGELWSFPLQSVFA